ncbi:MAG: hypothetical protein LBU97_02135 [Alistipes sp.]|jgi:hypothetical protein|nr:hypothetical protein [Alistipes sp.]
MAIRSIAQLKAWFKRGAYPTAEQFADWLDSYFHKEEKVPVSSVDGLTDRLNAKYDRTAGEELEREHDRLAADFEAHETANEVQFNNITGSIAELVAADETLNAKLESNPYIIDAQFAASGTDVTATYARYNAATGEQTTITRQFPVATEVDGGAMPPEAYQALVKLMSDVLVLQAQGGRFIGQSFTTQAALNAWAIPDTVNAGDFTYVLDDETHAGATTRWIASGASGALKFVFGFVVNNDPVGLATLVQAGIVKSSTKTGKVLVEADGTMSVIGWDALGERITQVQTDYRRDDAAIRLEVAAVRHTVLAIQSESAGRVIPLVMNVTPPRRITLGNPVRQFVKAELLPSFAMQNVFFMGDGKAVEVEPDGAVSVLGIGKSRVHVIPTENTALQQTVEVEVVDPSAITQTAAGLLLAGDSILLT